MSLAPVNPSDLIPITGAYSHRIQLPAVAGYEGIGRVLEAPDTHVHLIGSRVLPLRGDGTWQTFVDCDPELVIPVPESISDTVAACAYINPLAALQMLERWPVAGKRVLLSGAGSTCAELLGYWARQRGAAMVRGIYRSKSRVPRLLAHGVDPISIDDIASIKNAASNSDVMFDALGGSIGSIVLGAMPPGAVFIGYGLLSGRGVDAPGGRHASYRRFHLRDALATMTTEKWHAEFLRIWDLLRTVEPPSAEIFPLNSWQSALALTSQPGAPKALIRFSGNAD